MSDSSVMPEAKIDSLGAPKALKECERQIQYQCRILGLTEESHVAISNQNALNYALVAPDGARLIHQVSCWPDAFLPAVDELEMQAQSGFLSVHGRAKGETSALGLPYLSTLAASLSLQGAIATLIGYLRGGDITTSHTSLADAAVLAISQYLSEVSLIPEPRVSDREAALCNPPFFSKDGICFEIETLSPDVWRDFWTYLGMSGIAVAEGWKVFVQRYAKGIAPLPSSLVEKLRSYSWQELQNLCNQTGMSICALRSWEEVSQTASVQKLQSDGPWSFSEKGFYKPKITHQSSAMLPLSGIRVVESCRRIQGPLAASLMQFLGADVIRIEPPGGDPLRLMAPTKDGCSVRFDVLNKGKVIQELNIKSEKDCAQLKEIVGESDIFLHNWAPGKAEELGLADADLRRVNPGLIYFYAGGWAEDDDPGLPGTDFMVQAYSGVAHTIAQKTGSRGGSLFTILDILGGSLAAQGMCMALLKAHNQQVGIKGYSSLMGAASLLMQQGGHYQYPKNAPQKVAENLTDIYRNSAFASCLEFKRYCQAKSPWRFA